MTKTLEFPGANEATADTVETTDGAVAVVESTEPTDGAGTDDTASPDTEELDPEVEQELREPTILGEFRRLRQTLLDSWPVEHTPPATLDVPITYAMLQAAIEAMARNLTGKETITLPFGYEDRQLLRAAITTYADALEKEAKKLLSLGKPFMADELTAENARLTTHIRPQFQEQYQIPFTSAGVQTSLLDEAPAAESSPEPVEDDSAGGTEGPDGEESAGAADAAPSSEEPDAGAS